MTSISVLLDGFFPVVSSQDMPQARRRVGLQEIGLPYAADAAITRHMANFLRQQALRRVCARGQRTLPTHVLFNGGVLRAGIVRDRILETSEPVARRRRQTAGQGAHRRRSDACRFAGRGVLRPRAIRQRRSHSRRRRREPTMSAWKAPCRRFPGLPAPLKALTVAPFGMEEGTDHKFPDREFGLIVGEPAEFRFFTSATARTTRRATLFDDVGEELEELSPVEVNLPADGHAGEIVRVTLETVVTETGMLQLWCVANDGRRWKLEFNVRERVQRMNIGIDLGTTNSALAYIDQREAEDRDFPADSHFRDPATRAARTRRAAAHAAVVPVSRRRPAGTASMRASRARWCRPSLVHSAKSWLSNPDVDRTAKILPWDSQEAGRVLSPVEVSARYLPAIPRSMGKRKGEPLSEQDIVLTVPASFDEEARELTVMAAREAGIENLTLLEEPAAAFYSWIANHLTQSQKSLFDGQIVLVCDVGGGTSDFSLIRVQREGDLVDFTRTAVGKHLLLGGDNLDLTLAWLVESKLGTAALHPAAQRSAAAMLGRERTAA